jgi:hypothetical protein
MDDIGVEKVGFAVDVGREVGEEDSICRSLASMRAILSFGFGLLSGKRKAGELTKETEANERLTHHPSHSSTN